MEPKKIILINLKKEQSTRDHSAWYQTALQGHCYYKSLILASEKTCWSMEQNREPRNKPKSLWSKFKIIPNMEATSKNIRNYILKNDSNVRRRERHSHTIISLCICSSNEDFEPLVFPMEWQLWICRNIAPENTSSSHSSLTALLWGTGLGLST